MRVAKYQRGLIITADDFGLDRRVNVAVERAHREGVLNAASLMVSARAAQHAVECARRCPTLRVGLHIVLADGRSTLPPDEIPALVGPEGYFADAMVRDGFRFFFLPTVRAQLAREIRAQFDAFAATGLSLDHVNTHKHFHLHPSVLSLILSIGREYGLRAMRLPREVQGPVWLTPWMGLLRARLKRAGVAHNDYIAGMARTGAMDEAAFIDALADLPAGVTEIYCHPALKGEAALTPSMRAYRHADELDALLSPRVAAAIAAADVMTGGFADLFDDCDERQTGDAVGASMPAYGVKAVRRSPSATGARRAMTEVLFKYFRWFRWFKWAGWPIGIAIVLALVLHNGVADVVQIIRQAGFALLWLIPFHALPLLLDANGWRVLLRAKLARAPLVFLWWVATVREAVNRLLPAVGVGGELVGIRLARWRMDDASYVSASVIVEVFITIAVQYVFSALGLVLIFASSSEGGGGVKTMGLALLLSLPLPILAVALLRRGGVFHALERFAARMLGHRHDLLQGMDGQRLDAEIDMLMSRAGVMGRAFMWQFAGYVVGAFETYWALAMLGYPVSVGDAIAIEALTQAVRHAVFVVPAGLGVQEAAVVLLAQLFGAGHEVALSLALVKRMREVIFGCAALGSWQLAELLRTRRYVGFSQIEKHEACILRPSVAIDLSGERQWSSSKLDK